MEYNGGAYRCSLGGSNGLSVACFRQRERSREEKDGVPAAAAEGGLSFSRNDTGGQELENGRHRSSPNV